MLSITEVQLTSLSSQYAESSGLTGVLAQDTCASKNLLGTAGPCLQTSKSTWGELLLQPASILDLTWIATGLLFTYTVV